MPVAAQAATTARARPASSRSAESRAWSPAPKRTIRPGPQSRPARSADPGRARVRGEQRQLRHDAQDRTPVRSGLPPTRRRPPTRRVDGLRTCEEIGQATALSAGVSVIVVERRLATTSAPTMIATATSAMAMRIAGLAVEPTERATIGRRDEHRDQVHDLEQRVDRRAGGVLERVADGVTDDRGLVRGASPCRRGCRPRPASSRCPTRHRSWRGRSPSGCRWRSRRPGSRPVGRHRDRSRPRSATRIASRPGVASSRSESRVQMSTTRA